MGPSHPRLTKQRLGKLRVVRQQLLQRYEHQPFVSCLAGLYGCQWRRYERKPAQPGDCCCSKLEGASLCLITLTFGLCLVFLYFWSQAQNDYNDFDWFNFGNMGFWFPWSVVLLAISATLFIYVTVLLLLALCLLTEGQSLYLHWAHKVGVMMTLVIFIVATAVLSHLWGKEWRTLLLSFQVTAPYLHLGAVMVMVLLSWPMAQHFFRFNMRVRQIAILVLYLSVLSALYLVPLGMYSPCIMEQGNLGPAPTLIGHRGAPMCPRLIEGKKTFQGLKFAPENTYMSFEKALLAEGDGLETDVTISYDGVPFLMHDRSLMRTTNVKDVFPNRTSYPAAMFTWSELEMLNAGTWFFSQDPYGTASSLGPEEQTWARNQSICTLRAFLDLAAQHGKMVIFDLYRPPRGHPYRDTWITRTLEVIQNESSIHSSQVLWLPPELRELVQEMDPDLLQTSGSQAPLEELQQNRIVKLNLHYSAMSQEHIGRYAAGNISTNLYVVSEPWLYSLAWCAGAQSVTTNAVHILKGMRQPLFFMSPEEYNAMWVLTDVVSFVLIFTIFIFHWWRERGLALCTSGSHVLDGGSYTHFKTELDSVWSIPTVNILGDIRNPYSDLNMAPVMEVKNPAL